MRALVLGFVLCLLGMGRAAAADLTTLPQGLGFPVLVQTGLSFVNIHEVTENDGSFTATVDMRLRWRDPRLAYPRTDAPEGYVDYIDEAAEKKLKEIWNPRVEFGNLKAAPAFERRGLRIFPDGRVEMMQRTKGTFTTDYPLNNFPFDRQRLEVEILSRVEPLHRVQLDYRQSELEFSNTRFGGGVEGWKLGLVEMAKAPVVAWRGDMNTGMKVAQVVRRDQMSLLATIFVPLFASLLIPLLVLWLNKKENGEFTIEAFELTNISIGGLFAVVALNFTVNSSFVKLAVGDNPVMRLFGLNYLILGLSIAVGILLYRFNVVRRLFGPHVQEEFFIYINWAIPVLVFSTAAAMVAMALF
jgi:uncharacterized Tic20 family protein